MEMMCVKAHGLIMYVSCSYMWTQRYMLHQEQGIRVTAVHSVQVLLGRKYNEKADIFALSMIMFELFSSNLRLLQVCVQRNHQKTIFKYAHRMARGSRPSLPP